MPKSKKIVILAVFVNLLFIPYALATPLVGNWSLADGITAVLDPEGDGGEVGDEAVGRDADNQSAPDNEYYWGFEGLFRTKNILGDFIDNEDGTASLNIEIYRTGGTFKIHGDSIWGQPSGTIYEVSIDSYFNGINYFEKVGEEWVWKESTGSSYITGEFNNDPFLFELTSDTVLDDYGFNTVADCNVYMGTMANVVMTVTPVPEPTTMMLLGIGLLGLVGVSRRKIK